MTDPVTTYSTAVIAAFTIILALVGWRQARLTRKAIELAREEFETTQRAFIYLDRFEYELATAADNPDHSFGAARNFEGRDPSLFVTRFAVLPLWGNNGNTPPRKLRVRIRYESGLPGMVGLFEEGPGTPLFIAPKSTTLGEVIDIQTPNNQIQDGFAGTGDRVPDLLIWGRADYEDVFGKPHFIEWCYRVRPERHDGKKLRIHFIQWPKGNQSD